MCYWGRGGGHGLDFSLILILKGRGGRGEKLHVGQGDALCGGEAGYSADGYTVAAWMMGALVVELGAVGSEKRSLEEIQPGIWTLRSMRNYCPLLSEGGVELSGGSDFWTVSVVRSSVSHDNLYLQLISPDPLYDA